MTANTICLLYILSVFCRATWIAVVLTILDSLYNSLFDSSRDTRNFLWFHQCMIANIYRKWELQCAASRSSENDLR